ncbi:nodulate formation efficiency C protein [Bradyrhizobium sp. BRP20]|nr:nodulate formation efficiency C protein [Bradyrhizobium sp. IC3123]MCA1437293.1 nodulate formation efficiency C protein [Bradyrhizobium sp. BRP20]MCA1473163.1 nodulate formation efficiency C protein [Bradyrhizobium sp. IC3195]MCA1502031.1 nodulate formation efficiency C protein [Bradyrhizobium sp. NBAIM14]MCA1551378.1 nodulate formation efficiency C protein [Bradyrhizobium sp. BRP19]
MAGKGDGVRADDNPLIDKVRSTWRTEDGETAEEIFAKVARVAHFAPRGWEVGRKTDTGQRVVFSWAKHRSDKTTDENMVTWEVAPDGTVKLVTPYAKPMELGWQAFALSLVVDEVANNERGVNRRFLHDPANFNFVTTAQGKLGDLLRRGRCTIGEPVAVHYSPKIHEQQTAEDDLWRVELSVGCSIPGLGDGAIIFEKREGQNWEPQSVFAKLIATSVPGSWFELADPKDQEAFEPPRKTLPK